MREFAISNSSGEVYNLNNLRNFFHDPSGLGYIRTAEYTQIGDRYEIVKNGFEQATPTGLIRFKDEVDNTAYDKYLKFILFLQDMPLTLHYRSNAHHKIDVIAESVQKTEYTKALRGLDVAVTFRALSLWYDEVEASGTTTAVIFSDTKQEGPCHLKISGPLSNPSWSQNVDGVQIATGSVTAEIASGEVLHIRTDTNPYRLYKTNSNNVVTNLYGVSNFNTKRFMKLQAGLNTFICTGSSAISAEGRLYYESV